MCLARLLCLQQSIEKTLAYYKNCQFSVIYKSMMLYRFLSKLMCLARLLCLQQPIEKTLAYYKNCQFSVIYKSMMLYRFHRKLVCLARLLCIVTGNRKDTSLLQKLSIFCNLQIHDVVQIPQKASVFGQAIVYCDWQQKRHQLTTKIVNFL